MAPQKAKRPRSATRRTLPPDATSLVVMFHSVHRDLMRRGEHLKREPHDTHARRGFQTLFEQRAACWARLAEQNPGAADALRIEHNLTVTTPEVP